MQVSSYSCTWHRPDYKDFFYTHQSDGLVTLTVPNAKEKEAYDFDAAKMKGIVIIILSECDWGKCSEGDLKTDSIAAGQVKLSVNGIEVTSFIDIGSGCVILKHEKGISWQPSTNGDYEIGAQVMPENSYLRISSIVVY